MQFFYFFCFTLAFNVFSAIYASFLGVPDELYGIGLILILLSWCMFLLQWFYDYVAVIKWLVNWLEPDTQVTYEEIEDFLKYLKR